MFAAKRPSGGFRFVAGQRPCSVCSVFIDVNSYPLYRCPCCNNKSRLGSRNARSRKNRLNILYKSLTKMVVRREDKVTILPYLNK
jgi:hypothetical protein